MGKRLTEVDQYYINNHKGVSPEVLARRIGCTARTIYNYLAKNKGEARTEEGRSEMKGEEPKSAPTIVPVHEPNGTVPINMNSFIQRGKNSTAMTKQAAELADEIIDRSGPGPNPDYMHVINPNK